MGPADYRRGSTGLAVWRLGGGSGQRFRNWAGGE